MPTLVLLLWVIAAVLVTLRGFGVVLTKWHLGWLGLAVALVAVFLERI